MNTNQYDVPEFEVLELSETDIVTGSNCICGDELMEISFP